MLALKPLFKNIRRSWRSFLRRLRSADGRKALEKRFLAVSAIREDDFNKALVFLLNKLKEREHFAFSKYADGELKILRGEFIDITRKEHGEFKFNPDSRPDNFYRRQLIESFRYRNEQYYVGIGCPCCIGDDDFSWMKEFSGQDEKHLTWANIFVNANYPCYLKEFVHGEFKKRKVVIVCNKLASLKDLPFDVHKDFRIGVDAWKNDYALIGEIKEWMRANRTEDFLFLFCAGPFGNMLSAQLFDFNRNNTYLDVGSTLDIYLGLGATRSYLRGGGDLDKVCVWS